MNKYKYDHPDSDLFNEKTLGDYLSRKAPWPCVVVGVVPEQKVEPTVIGEVDARDNNNMGSVDCSGGCVCGPRCESPNCL